MALGCPAAPCSGPLSPLCLWQTVLLERSTEMGIDMPGRCWREAQSCQLHSKGIVSWRTCCSVHLKVLGLKKIDGLVGLVSCWGTCMLFAVCLLEKKTLQVILKVYKRYFGSSLCASSLQEPFLQSVLYTKQSNLLYSQSLCTEGAQSHSKTHPKHPVFSAVCHIEALRLGKAGQV